MRKNEMIADSHTVLRSAVEFQPLQHDPKLLELFQEALHVRHYSNRTEERDCYWVKRFVHFHNMRHPKEMGVQEINAFLTHLVVAEKVSASTQNQALSALLFLYRNVIGKVRTTMIYTHVLNRGPSGVRSPVDGL